MKGGQDFSTFFSQEEKFFSRLSSRDVRYNSSISKQGEASFRVLYYGGATGSVPFVWESQPGTPKHKFGGGGNGSPLPPLTPPPQYISSPLASPSLKKSRSKMFGSVFMRTPSKKSGAPASPSSCSSSSSSRYSSSYSLPSTPFHSGSKARLGSKIEFGDEDEEGTGSPTSTLCFGVGDGRRSKGYQFFYPVKKVVKSIAGGLRR